MRGGGGWEGSSDSRGQAETIGVVLVLAMTLVGATVALAFGATALNDARLNSQHGGVEHAMTQLDSRSAMVALGDSSTQQVRLPSSGQGSYRIDPDAGWIKVTHLNYDGNGVGNNEVIYNETLGAIVYDNDGTIVAYQGGGIWVAEGDGSRMVSPPEFHYQSATLTLPVIRVEGTSSVGGGGVTATISQVSRANRIYPNRESGYPDDTGNYTNPVREGNVTVTVQSDYYEAWAKYFETRTSGNITVDHDAETVRVKLISLGTVGAFTMPSEGRSIEVRGLSGDHPIDDFTITIWPTNPAEFNRLQWSLYVEQGSQDFEMYVSKGEENTTAGTTDCTAWNVEATVYYYDTNEDGDGYHGWHDEEAFVTTCEDIDGDGTNETFLEANLTGTSKLEMKELTSSNLNQMNPQGTKLKDEITSDHHDGIVWEQDDGTTFTETNRTTIGNLTNHYLSLMGPNVELTVSDQNGGIDEGASSGNLEYSGTGGSFITFLHITENRVGVEIE